MNKIIKSVNKNYKDKIPQNILDSFEEIYPYKDIKNNIEYFGLNPIIPVKIFKMIINILSNNKSIEFPKIQIFEKNNNIYLIYLNKNIIEIGNINTQLLFIPKYILKFDSNEILNEEIKKLLSYSFEDYLIIRDCSENDDEFQQLKKSMNETIGLLIILDNKKMIRSNSKENLNKNIINKKDLKYNRGKTTKNLNKIKNIENIKNLVSNKNNKKSNDYNSLYMKQNINNNKINNNNNKNISFQNNIIDKRIKKNYFLENISSNKDHFINENNEKNLFNIQNHDSIFKTANLVDNNNEKNKENEKNDIDEMIQKLQSKKKN